MDKYKTLNSKYVISTLFYVLLVAGIFLVMFILNRNTPMIGDDYVYSFIFSSSQKINNINDIINSQYIHYNMWGGRIIVHSILQYLILLKNPLFTDILNALIFTFYIIIIEWHIIGKIKYNFLLTFLVFTITFLIQPAFGETVLWLTGSLNYLWGTTIILFFLLPYRLYNNKQTSLFIKIISALFMFIGGIVAGWVSENLSLSMIFISILFLLNYKYNHYKVPLWSIMGIIGATIGYVLLIIAPGNYVRGADAGPTLFLIIYRTLTYTQDFIYYLGIINLYILISFIIYKKNFNKSFNKDLPIIIIYVSGLFISIYSMVFSPSFPPRAWFGVISINIILLGIAFEKYRLFYSRTFSSIKAPIIFFALIALFFNIYDAYKDTRSINLIWEKRILDIEAFKQQGKNDIVFEKYSAKTKFGMSDAPYANKQISDYYSINFNLK